MAIREEPAEHEQYEFRTEARMFVGQDTVALAQDDKVSPELPAVPLVCVAADAGYPSNSSTL